MDYWARWCNLILKAHYENWRQGIQTDHIAHSVFVSSCTTRFDFYLTSPHTCTHTHWEDAICYIHLLHTMKPIPSFSFECGYFCSHFCSVYILHVCGTALRKYHQCSSCTVQLLQVSFCIFRVKIQQRSSDYFQQNIVSVAEPSSTVHENEFFSSIVGLYYQLQHRNSCVSRQTKWVHLHLYWAVLSSNKFRHCSQHSVQPLVTSYWHLWLILSKHSTLISQAALSMNVWKRAHTLYLAGSFWSLSPYVKALSGTLNLVIWAVINGSP